MLASRFSWKQIDQVVIVNNIFFSSFKYFHYMQDVVLGYLSIFKYIYNSNIFTWDFFIVIVSGLRFSSLQKQSPLL